MVRCDIAPCRCGTVPDSLLSTLLDLLPDFEFEPSLAKGDWDTPPVMAIETAAARDGETVQRFELTGNSPTRVDGDKHSQRAEVKETTASDDANTAGETLWYALSIKISYDTLAPTDGPGRDAKMSLVQFHQRDSEGTSDKPALMIYLQSDGTLLAQFEEAVGKRDYALGELDVRGQWIDLAIGSHWDTDAGWTEIWVRPEGAEYYTQVARDEGPNTSTGHVYVKYGLYKSFLERDPDLAEADAVAYFDAIDRADRFETLDLPAPVLPEPPSTVWLNPPVDSFVFDLG